MHTGDVRLAVEGRKEGNLQVVKCNMCLGQLSQCNMGNISFISILNNPSIFRPVDLKDVDGC